MAPIWVSNMSLKGMGAVNCPTAPQLGQTLLLRSCGSASTVLMFTCSACSSAFLVLASSRWSTRVRVLHFLHSETRSANLSAWPEAFQTSGCMKMLASRPTTSSRIWTTFFHQARLTLFFSSTPSGP